MEGKAIKLFTRGDLARAARLGAIYKMDGLELREAVDKAVDDVANETPPYYSEDDVRKIVDYVMANGGWGGAAPSEVLKRV